MTRRRGGGLLPLERHRTVDDRDRPKRLVLDIDDHAAVYRLRWRECLGDAEDRRVGHFERGEDRHELIDGVFAGEGGDDLVDLGARIAALFERVVTRIGGQVLAADRLADPPPEPRRQAGDHDGAPLPAIGMLGRENAIRHEVGMLRALAHRIRAGEEGELGDVAEHADQPVHQADVDEASPAGALALVQRGEDADGSVDPAD